MSDASDDSKVMNEDDIEAGIDCSAGINTPPLTAPAERESSSTTSRRSPDCESDSIVPGDDAEAGVGALFADCISDKSRSRTTVDSDVTPTSLHDATTLVTSNLPCGIDTSRSLLLQYDVTRDTDENRSDPAAASLSVLDVWKTSHDETVKPSASTAAPSPILEPVAPMELEDASWEVVATTAIPDQSLSTDDPISSAASVFADARVVVHQNESVPLPIQHIHSTVPVNESDTRTDSPPLSTCDPQSIVAPASEKTTRRRSTAAIVAGIVLFIVVITAVLLAVVCRDGECISGNETEPNSRPTPTQQPSQAPTRQPTAFPTPNGGFCNWGPDGSAASSTCEGGTQGGEFCNVQEYHCTVGCGGRWCNKQPSPAHVALSSIGYCNFGFDGTGNASICEGGAQGGDYCNAGPDVCVSCDGRWCNGNGNPANATVNNTNEATKVVSNQSSSGDSSVTNRTNPSAERDGLVHGLQ